MNVENLFSLANLVSCRATISFLEIMELTSWLPLSLERPFMLAVTIDKLTSEEFGNVGCGRCWFDCVGGG